MTDGDVEYVRYLLSRGVIGDSVVELGAGYGGSTCREMILSTHHRYVGTDLHPAPGVDVVADFESGDGLDDVIALGPFDTALVLNVLEHTFDPVRVLDNALRVVNQRGNVVVIAPALWPLHNYPMDSYRLLPDWYRKFAELRHLVIPQEFFSYITFGSINNYRDIKGEDRFPHPARSASYRLYCRIVHRLFNTFARGISQPVQLGIGAVLSRKTT